MSKNNVRRQPIENDYGPLSLRQCVPRGAGRRAYCDALMPRLRDASRAPLCLTNTTSSSMSQNKAPDTQCFTPLAVLLSSATCQRPLIEQQETRCGARGKSSHVDSRFSLCGERERAKVGSLPAFLLNKSYPRFESSGSSRSPFLLLELEPLVH